MPPTPSLRARLASGQTYDDPSEDLLYMLFEDILNGAEEFFIVERLSDPSGLTYVQTTLRDNGWIVERRSGAPETHLGATVADHRSAHALVTTWCHGASLEAPPSVDWKPVQY